MQAPGETILRVSDVSKVYARSPGDMRRRAVRLLGPALFGAGPPGFREPAGKEFFAVKDVSFSLERGKAIGVIGLNGSGKTTLLRMLAGQILPDCGEIWISGGSAAMIDLTAGFQPTASGRRNIYMRAAALGFSRMETDAMLDEIIAFSELGDAIEAPMASYSSGMMMRLAFSVMAMVAPDILFIDEVLAVGDFRFKQKCLAKVREMRERSAFVFVSHSMGDIEQFCDEVIVMHKGRMHFIGAPREAIEIYEQIEADTVPAKTTSASRMGPTYINEQTISDVETYWCDENGEPVGAIAFNEPIRLFARFRSSLDFRNLIIGVPIWNENNQYTTGISTQITMDRFHVGAGEHVRLMAEIGGGVINPGVLKSMFTILDGPEFLYRQPNPDLTIRGAPHPTWGAVTLQHSWRRLGENG